MIFRNWLILKVTLNNYVSCEKDSQENVHRNQSPSEINTYTHRRSLTGKSLTQKSNTFCHRHKEIKHMTNYGNIINYVLNRNEVKRKSIQVTQRPERMYTELNKEPL